MMGPIILTTPVLAEVMRDALRYRWLRGRDLDQIGQGGIFVGQTPRNVVLTGEDLDHAVDAEIGLG